MSSNFDGVKSYLLPESRLPFNIMREILCLRLDKLELPYYAPYKFNQSKLCRFQCNEMEDIEHIINCKNDNIVDKNCQVNELKDIINAIFKWNIENSISELIRIQYKRNTLLNIQ